MTGQERPIDVLELVREVHRDLDAAIAARGPVCRLSGRCCKFEEYGHTLFLSRVERETLIADAPAPVRPLDDGETCPWQDTHGRCNAREGRPLGCRVYYCDPTYEAEAGPISEEFLGRLKRIADAAGLPWDYRPLHRHLREVWPTVMEGVGVSKEGTSEGPDGGAA